MQVFLISDLSIGERSLALSSLGDPNGDVFTTANRRKSWTFLGHTLSFQTPWDWRPLDPKILPKRAVQQVLGDEGYRKTHGT